MLLCSVDFRLYDRIRCLRTRAEGFCTAETSLIETLFLFGRARWACYVVRMNGRHGSSSARESSSSSSLPDLVSPEQRLTRSLAFSSVGETKGSFAEPHTGNGTEMVAVKLDSNGTEIFRWQVKESCFF